MKIVQINTFPSKATGSIMMNLHKQMQKQGIDSYVVWGRGRKPENDHEISIADELGVNFHGVYSRVTDKTGFASNRATKKLIEDLKKISPDIIHLHNIHGYYVNIEILFNYIRLEGIKVVWTMHDCWAFTGHCAYFDRVGCEKWKTGCHSCEQLHTYPASILKDNSEWNFQKKKELFTGLDVTLVTPSYWLSQLVKQSYLKNYPVEIIYNGVDLDVFKPSKGLFRKKYGIEDKFIILGVASEWTERKGLNDFILLEKRMNDNFKIVIVGLNNKQKSKIPDTIIALERTSDVQELIEIYSAADIFFNPTYEDNFPTTNLESLACGTPVCTYRTGGSPESLDKKCGIILEPGDVESFANMLINGRKKKFGMIFDIDSVLNSFKKEDMISNYLKLYESSNGKYK